MGEGWGVGLVLLGGEVVLVPSRGSFTVLGFVLPMFKFFFLLLLREQVAVRSMMMLARVLDFIRPFGVIKLQRRPNEDLRC